MGVTNAGTVRYLGFLALLGYAGCSPVAPQKETAGDPSMIADDFAKAADRAADFIATVRNKNMAVKEEGNVNHYLANVLRKREPYDRLVLDGMKPAAGKRLIPAAAKDRADQAAERFDRELTRFQRLLGTQQTGKGP